MDQSWPRRADLHAQEKNPQRGSPAPSHVALAFERAHFSPDPLNGGGPDADSRCRLVDACAASQKPLDCPFRLRIDPSPPDRVSFIAINLACAMLFLGGGAGLAQLVRNSGAAVMIFSLTPIPLFILMGEMLFHTDLALYVIDGSSG